MLCWLVFEINGQKCVWIDEANSVLQARLQAGIAGYSDGYLEGHQLDKKTAKKVPKDMVRKCLKAAAARRLLAKLA
jgi:hypothetical protein